jgi:hypothetical protein
MPIVVLRRLDQPLEILPPPEGRGVQNALRILARPATGELREFTSADMLYIVDLPRDYELRPGDWRPLIDDHPELEALIREIVGQNTVGFQFEPISDALLRRIESAIRQALADVSRAFDVIDVRCEHQVDDVLHVIVSGEHKNGSLVNIVFPIRSTA